MKTTFTYEQADLERLIRNDLIVKQYKPINFIVKVSDKTNNILTIQVECEEVIRSARSTSYMDQ